MGIHRPPWISTGDTTGCSKVQARLDWEGVHGFQVLRDQPPKYVYDHANDEEECSIFRYNLLRRNRELVIQSTNERLVRQKRNLEIKSRKTSLFLEDKG
jgi:hypothetical protein